MEIRNRKVNPHKKQRPESIDELQNLISGQKEAIERGNEIVRNLKGNPGWEALCLTSKEEIDELDGQLDNFENFEERIVPVMLKRRADLREFSKKVDDIEKKVLELHEEMAGNIADLNERKQRARTAVQA